MRTKRPLEDRFWEKVAKTDDPSGCWVWTATKNNKGYGLLSISAAVGKRLAHRISYEIHFGRIPKGLFVLHSCDNPLCVNPTHLRIGDQTANMADAISRGRKASPPTHRGERHPKAKLTAKDVRRIRKQIANGKSPIQIASELGMNKTTIYDIRNRKLWPHV